jgi:hypothetical protein
MHDPYFDLTPPQKPSKDAPRVKARVMPVCRPERPWKRYGDMLWSHARRDLAEGPSWSAELLWATAQVLRQQDPRPRRQALIALRQLVELWLEADDAD